MNITLQSVTEFTLFMLAKLNNRKNSYFIILF